MAYFIRWKSVPNAVGLDDRVAVLANDDAPEALFEIWPALGFNAYRWRIAGQEVLYWNESMFQEKRPTRWGIPPLFPFPNRIRDGRFRWDGVDYELPRVDSTRKNAIHGFACHHPWRVVDEGADSNSAWITGVFQASVDAPTEASLWPADYRIALTYRLSYQQLSLTAVIDNPDTKPLPCGLGFHPYFDLAPFGGEDAIVEVPAQRAWVLAENLPTGAVVPVAGDRDLRTGKALRGLQLDDVLTGLDRENRSDVSRISDPSGKRNLVIECCAGFREMVVFTPPHRKAFCVEPYTCTTDAINLQAQGIDAGWRVLLPGERWELRVDLKLQG
jgi:aldose 1-epimerase